MSVKKATNKKSKPLNEEEKSELGDFDVSIKYEVELQVPDGTPIKVKGEIPLHGALMPVFLRESLKTVESTMDTLVKDRFLTQTRHYFYNLMEKSNGDSPEVKRLELQQQGPALELGVESKEIENAN